MMKLRPILLIFLAIVAVLCLVRFSLVGKNAPPESLQTSEVISLPELPQNSLYKTNNPASPFAEDTSYRASPDEHEAPPTAADPGTQAD